MLILAVDTSNNSSSVSLVRDENVLGEIYLDCGIVRSKAMCVVLKNLLNFTSIDLKKVDAFAVCSGPGSYTGIRIGTSLVKGLSFSSKKKCVGISSLYALAYLVQNVDEKNVVYACIRANDEEIYFNSYLFDRKNGYVVPVSEDKFVKFNELSEIIKSEKRQIILVTDDYDFVSKNLNDCINLIGRVEVGNIKSSSIGVLACHQIIKKFECNIENLKPNYIKEVKIDRGKNV